MDSRKPVNSGIEVITREYFTREVRRVHSSFGGTILEAILETQDKHFLHEEDVAKLIDTRLKKDLAEEAKTLNLLA